MLAREDRPSGLLGRARLSGRVAQGRLSSLTHCGELLDRNRGFGFDQPPNSALLILPCLVTWSSAPITIGSHPGAASACVLTSNQDRG